MAKFTSYANSTKLPAMVIAWENLQEVFVMLVVVVVVFTSLEVFTFLGYFSLPPAFHPSFSGPMKGLHWLWALPWLLLLLYFCQAFPPHFYRECYGFEWVFFTHGRFLPYTPFVTQMMVGAPLPESSSVPALTELSLPADAWTSSIDVWITRPLIYQLRQWATKYRVKIKLLNIFCLFKSHM